jgi:hypothetical protein
VLIWFAGAENAGVSGQQGIREKEISLSGYQGAGIFGFRISGLRLMEIATSS